MSGWSVSVYPVKDVSCAMKVPEVEMREWVEERVILFPVNVIVSNRRVDVASSVKSVSVNEEVLLCVIVNPVIVTCTPEIEKKGVDEQEVTEKVSGEER